MTLPVLKSTTLYPASLKLLCVIQELTQNNTSGWCNDENAYLAKRTGYSIHMIKKAKAQLVGLELVAYRVDDKTKRKQLQPRPQTKHSLLLLQPCELPIRIWEELVLEFPRDPWIGHNLLHGSTEGKTRYLHSVKSPAFVERMERKLLTYITQYNTVEKLEVSSIILRDSDNVLSAPSASGLGAPPSGRREPLSPKPHSPMTARKSISDALTSDTFKDANKRIVHRSKKKKVKKALPKPAVNLSPLDLTRERKWTSRTLFEFIQALSSAYGVENWFAANPGSVGRDRAIGEINQFRLAFDNHFQNTHEFARFLKEWFEHWEEFCIVVPNAKKIGFSPAYWRTTWKIVLDFRDSLGKMTTDDTDAWTERSQADLL